MATTISTAGSENIMLPRLCFGPPLYASAEVGCVGWPLGESALVEGHAHCILLGDWAIKKALHCPMCSHWFLCRESHGSASCILNLPLNAPLILPEASIRHFSLYPTCTALSRRLSLQCGHIIECTTFSSQTGETFQPSH